MFSLVITLIAVALAIAIAMATIFYASQSWREATPKAQASRALNQGAQVLAAGELLRLNTNTWPTDLDELVGKGYLQSVPIFNDGFGPIVWSQPMTLAPVFWALRSTGTDACKHINRLARGDDGIYLDAKPGLQLQCFGPSAPYTVIATRYEPATDGTTALDAPLGLRYVLEFVNDPTLGFHRGYGRWAQEPTEESAFDISIGGPRDSSSGVFDRGTSDGVFLNGVLRAFRAVDNEGTNSIEIRQNGPGTPRTTIRFANTDATTLVVRGVSACSPVRVASHTCGGSLSSGANCTITLEGPISPANSTSATNYSGCVQMHTPKGIAEVSVSGVSTHASTDPINAQAVDELGQTIRVLHFPDTTIGQESLRTFRIRNEGVALNFSAGHVTEPFYFVSDSCNAVPLGGACDVTVAFRPSRALQYLDSAHQVTLNANGHRIELGLVGLGLPLPAPALEITPSSVDFGTSYAFRNVSKTVTLKNTGNVPLTFTQGATLSIQLPAGLSLSTTHSQFCKQGTQLSVGNSCMVPVHLTPQDGTPVATSFNWQTAQLGMASVPISGQGTNPLVANPLTLKTFNGFVPTVPDLSTAFLLAASSGPATPVPGADLSIRAVSGFPPGITLNTNTRKLEGDFSSVPAGNYTMVVASSYKGQFNTESQITWEVAPGTAPSFRWASDSLYFGGITLSGVVSLRVELPYTAGDATGIPTAHFSIEGADADQFELTAVNASNSYSCGATLSPNRLNTLLPCTTNLSRGWGVSLNFKPTRPGVADARLVVTQDPSKGAVRMPAPLPLIASGHDITNTPAAWYNGDRQASVMIDSSVQGLSGNHASGYTYRHSVRARIEPGREIAVPATSFTIEGPDADQFKIVSVWRSNTGSAYTACTPFTGSWNTAQGSRSEGACGDPGHYIVNVAWRYQPTRPGPHTAQLRAVGELVPDEAITWTVPAAPFDWTLIAGEVTGNTGFEFARGTPGVVQTKDIYLRYAAMGAPAAPGQAVVDFSIDGGDGKYTIASVQKYRFSGPAFAACGAAIEPGGMATSTPCTADAVVHGGTSQYYNVRVQVRYTPGTGAASPAAQLVVTSVEPKGTLTSKLPAPFPLTAP